MKLFCAERLLAGGVAGRELSQSTNTGGDAFGPYAGSRGVAVLTIGSGQGRGPWATVTGGRS